MNHDAKNAALKLATIVSSFLHDGGLSQETKVLAYTYRTLSYTGDVEEALFIIEGIEITVSIRKAKV